VQSRREVRDNAAVLANPMIWIVSGATREADKGKGEGDGGEKGVRYTRRDHDSPVELRRVSAVYLLTTGRGE
jgi:hypothetical protein